jgi:hypothetical protein
MSLMMNNGAQQAVIAVWKWLHTNNGRRCSAVVLLVAFALACLHFGVLWWSLLHLPPQGDAYVFFGVARALLNGYRLYWDIFEVKPPLILWLMAWSLQMNSLTLYMWIQMLLELLLAPLLGWYIYRTTRHLWATATAILLGLTVAFEISARTGGYLMEGFGLPFIVVALLLFSRPQRHMWSDLMAGILVGVATMIKEPFAPAFVCAALLFCRSQRDVRSIVYIAVFAAITAISILLLTGSFTGYFLVYLPEMFTGRGMDKVPFPSAHLGMYYFVPASNVVRAFNAIKVFTMMLVPLQSVFWVAFFVLCTGLYAPLRATSTKLNSRFSFVSIATVLFVAHVGYVINGFWQATSLATGIQNEIIGPLFPIVLGGLQIVLLVLAPLAAVLSFYVGRWLWRSAPPMDQCWLLLRLWLCLFGAAALAAYGADYFGQYLAFAMPFFIVLAVICLQESARRQLLLVPMVLSALLVLHTLVPGRTAHHLQVFAPWSEIESVPAQARYLDAVMDACDIDRYFPIRSLDLFAPFAHHSPYQAFWGQRRALGAVWQNYQVSAAEPNRYFEHKFMQDLTQAQLLVGSAADDPAIEQYTEEPTNFYPNLQAVHSSPSRIPAPLVRVLQQEFTLKPPACAKTVTPAAGIKLFFRKGAFTR